jgi:hypothetical protein
VVSLELRRDGKTGQSAGFRQPVNAFCR